MESKRQNRSKSLLRRVINNIVQDVPPEVDVCEMCRKPRCPEEEWTVCENRTFHLKCVDAYEKNHTAPRDTRRKPRK